MSAVPPFAIAPYTSSASIHPVQLAVYQRLCGTLQDLSGTALAYAQVDASLDGRVINADSFRDVSPEYRTGELRAEDEARMGDLASAARDRRWLRTWLTSATTNPAAAASRYWAEREAARIAHSGGTMLVVFGGSGSGKTRALNDIGESLEEAEVIYDSTLTDQAHALRLVELFGGSDRLRFIFVATDFSVAVARMIRRAQHDGRYIPLSGMVENHRKSRLTLQALANAGYADRLLLIHSVENHLPQVGDVAAFCRDPLTLSGITYDCAYAVFRKFDRVATDLEQRMAR